MYDVDVWGNDSKSCLTMILDYRLKQAIIGIFFFFVRSGVKTGVRTSF